MRTAIVLIGFFLLACWFAVAVRLLQDAWHMSLGHASAFAAVWAALCIALAIWYESPRQRKKRAERRAREFRA